MKKYTKPNIEITIVNVNDVIAASGDTPSISTLTNKGENGQPLTESFNTMFGS